MTPSSYNSINDEEDPLVEQAAEYTGNVETERTKTGFTTPQEAAKAYINGLCEMDYEMMMSACAVDIYVEKYDLEKRVGNAKSLPRISTNKEPFLPYEDPLSSALNYNSRRKMINRMIMAQYLTILYPEIDISQTVSWDETVPAAQFIRDRYGEGRVPEVTFRGEFLSPILFRDKYYSYNNLKNEYESAQLYGMTRSISLMGVLYFDGVPGFMALDTCCYDGRWYVTDSINLARFFDLSYGGILVPMTDTFTNEELSEYKNFIAGLLSNETLMSASAKVDEAFLNLDLQALIMAGEEDSDSAENMIETTWTSVLTPQELELIKEYKGSLLYE